MLSGLGDTYGFSSCNDVFPDDDTDIIVLENMAVNPDGSFDAAAGVAFVVRYAHNGWAKVDVLRAF